MISSRCVERRLPGSVGGRHSLAYPKNICIAPIGYKFPLRSYQFHYYNTKYEKSRYQTAWEAVVYANLCIRAKHRGHPKAYGTKLLSKISGRINYSGTVISHKMSENKMGNRGYKSAICENIAVKEQRVDGSSDSRNLDSVRCTLVAGKPVLGWNYMLVI